MAKIVEVWEGLDKLIRARAAEENGIDILFHDKMELSEKGNRVIRGSKYIIGADDRNAALNLRVDILQYLQAPENQITAKENQKPKQYKLNVKIVDNVERTVKLKMTAAKNTRYYTYDAVMKYLDEKEQFEEGNHEDTAAECRKARQKLINHYLMTGDEYYYVTKFSGAAYRVNYYDTEKRQSNQVSVGDILILVGADEILTSDTKSRGERADRLTAESADVIAKVWWTFIRVLPEEIKEELRQKANGKAQ